MNKMTNPFIIVTVALAVIMSGCATSRVTTRIGTKIAYSYQQAAAGWTDLEAV